MKDFRKYFSSQMKESALDKAVILDILQHDGSNVEEGRQGMIDYMVNVSQGGGISGSIGTLIYYKDTVEFYKKNLEDIWELIYEKMDEFGCTLGEFVDSLSPVPGNYTQFQNLMAWFAYENRINQYLNDLEIEI